MESGLVHCMNGFSVRGSSRACGRWGPRAVRMTSWKSNASARWLVTVSASFQSYPYAPIMRISFDGSTSLANRFACEVKNC